MIRKIWLRIFLNMCAIVASFALLIVTANSSLLLEFYVRSQRIDMIKASKAINEIDFTDTDEAIEDLEGIYRETNYSITVVDNETGQTISTERGPVLGTPGTDTQDKVFGKAINVTDEKVINSTTVFATGTDRRLNREVYILKVELSNGRSLELSTPKGILEQSAEVANQFVIIILIICLAVSLVWAVLFARRFSKPISEMNTITHDMAKLNFDRRLFPKTQDEIGQLGSSINELSDKLDITLRDLSEKNERLQGEIERERALDAMRKGFVANVSHELKTPISIIQGYAEGLKLGVSDNSDEYVNVIIEESNLMNRLVLDLIELSRYESGGMKLIPETLNLYELAGSVLTKNSDKAVAKDVKLFNYIDPALIAVADSVRMEQVLTNYLSNALSHVNSGGEIIISSAVRDEGIWIYVYNSGSRISDEDKDKLWQSFYRGDKSHNRNEGRYGLGLSIVRAIMELHGGDCSVDNTETGVVFGAMLPKTDE